MEKTFVRARADASGGECQLGGCPSVLRMAYGKRAARGHVAPRSRIPGADGFGVEHGAGLENETGSTPMQRSGKVPNVYPWGPQWPPPRGAGNFASKLTIDDFDHTSPVGSFAANQFSLYDMGGNVFQWCEDSGNSGSRVLRGSSWTAVEPGRLLSSYRGNSPPDTGSNVSGFRCVLAGGGVSASR